MTGARAATLAICVPVALSLIGWGAFSAVAAVGTGQYTFSMPVSVSGGKLTAHVSNGDVTLTFVKVPRDVKVTSNIGDVSIVLPHGSYRFNVSSSIGDTSHPASDPSSGNLVTATTTTGDITITES